MKIMNKSISIFATLFVAMFLFSCGEKQTLKMWQIVDDKQDVTNSGKGSVDLTVLKGELQTALTHDKEGVTPTSPHGYQYSNANTVDVFAGYTVVSRSDFQYGPELTHTYQWPNGYYGSACAVGPTASLYNTYTYAERLGYPEYKAIAQIIYAQTALHAVNNAGCIPYEDNRKLKQTRPLKYLSMEETYNAILSDLDEAIATLKATDKDPVEALLEIEGEGYSKGNADYAFSEYSWAKWIKLANTIKLRIALYLSKPEPARSLTIAQEAIADGVLDEDFGPSFKKGQTAHPYYTISGEKMWNDSRLGASFENILKRTASPLISKIFDKNIGAVSDINSGTKTKDEADYYGVRQGTSVGKKVIGQGYYNFSPISVQYQWERLLWVTKEEVIFMQAEVALRSGDKATAKTLYEEGIRTSFERYGVSDKLNKYLAQTEVQKVKKNGKWIDADFVDIYDSKNNLPGRLGICVAWDDNDTEEVMLEKIITQKWIAIFPCGHEAWVDYRRTGYPRLFPSVQKWQGVPSFEKELQLRRIPHNESDDNVANFDLPNIKKALSVFGEAGKNSGGQRLYFEGDPATYPWSFEPEYLDEVDDKGNKIKNPRAGWPIPINF